MPNFTLQVVLKFQPGKARFVRSRALVFLAFTWVPNHSRHALQKLRIAIREFASTIQRPREVGLLALVCIALSIRVSMATPAFANPDEGAHYLRAYEVRKLRLVNRDGRQGVRFPCKDYVALTKNFPVPFQEKNGHAYVNKDKPKCSVHSMNTAAAYPFVAYLSSSLWVRLGDALGWPIETDLVASRITNGILGVLAMVLGLLAVDKLRYVLAFVFLLPMSFWQRSALSPDALMLSAQFVFTCFVVRMAEQRNVERGLDWFVLMVSAVLIASSKGAYAFMCLCTFVLWSLRPDHQSRAAYAARLASPFLLGYAISKIWGWLGQMSYELPVHEWGWNASAQSAYIEAHPWEFLQLLFDNVSSAWQLLGQLCIHGVFVSQLAQGVISEVDPVFWTSA